MLHAAFFVFEPNQSYIVIQLNSNMKALYIFLGLGAIYIVFQSFIANSAVKTEKQKYRTVVKDDELEIRYYPAATMATVYSSATNYKSVASSGFGKLARFIFGGNKENESIRIHESAPQYVAVVSFGGYANDEKIKTHKEKLLQILSQRYIKVTGDYTYLGYNAPYQMIARTNEIAIPIEWKE